MALTDDEIVQILKLLDESNYDELQLETDSLKLVVRRGGKLPSIKEGETGFTIPTRPVPPEEPVIAEKAQDTAAGTGVLLQNTVTQTQVATVEEKGLVAITASSVGTLYRAPKPGAPPFVEIGTFVTEEDPLCLLEVMKCFISVKAKMRGHVAKIFVENGQMVEYGQELFLIKPAESKGKPQTNE